MLSDHVPHAVQAPSGLDPLTLVSHSGSPLLVRGPAGSGKTRLLLERFGWLVEQGMLPERIALVTPSQARADSARATLEQKLQDGYSELVVVTPPQFAAALLRRTGTRPDLVDATLGAGDRLAMLAERINELPLQHHDFGGNAGALLGGFIRRIDRLKAESIGADDFAQWAETQPENELEQEFAEIFKAHDRMLREAGACDAGDLVRIALKLLGQRPVTGQTFQHVLVDDAQELDLTSATLAWAAGGRSLTVAGDPLAALWRFRGAGAARLRAFETEDTHVVTLTHSYRCPAPLTRAAWTLALETPPEAAASAEEPDAHIAFWRCANERAQAQSVAAEIERLIAREQTEPGAIAVIVPEIAKEGQAMSLALQERAVQHTVIGEAAFYQRAEIRDLLAWLRLLADPSDAPAVVRALARGPIELRSVDIARCTQIARRRKLDMVAALAAALESPQVPPEARERIRVFLKLYRAAATNIDTMRPDLYVHRLVERLGLRRQQLFAAQADVVERLRALARFGEARLGLCGPHPAGHRPRVRPLDRGRRRVRRQGARGAGGRAAQARGRAGDPARRRWRPRAGARVRHRPEGLAARRSRPATGADPGRAFAGAAATGRRADPPHRPVTAPLRGRDARPAPGGVRLPRRRRARRRALTAGAGRRRPCRLETRLGGPRRGPVRPRRGAAVDLQQAP